MELRQLRQAVMLAETLNFTRAAERLHMAQPPLSASIRKLEEELGIVLFDRLPSGVKLSSTGEAVMREARLTLFHAEQVRRTAKEGSAGNVGTLRLGFTGAAAYELVPRLLRAFREQYPKVGADIYESNTSELLRRIESQELDVAIVAYPVLEKTPAELILLHHEHLMVAVRADSPLAARDEVTLADIASEPLIIHSRTQAPDLHAIVLHAFRQAGVRPNVVQEAVQVSSMLGLVEGGLGLAFVSSVVLGHISTQVKLLRLSGPGSQMNLGMALATLPGGLTPSARNFVQLAKGLMQPTSPD